MKSCLVKYCKRVYLAKGFCRMHYLRWHRGYDIGSLEPRKKPNGTYSRYLKGKHEWYDKNMPNILARKWREENYKTVVSMNRYRFGGMKEDVLKRDQYKCQICGMSNENHKKRYGNNISVDHIDGSGRDEEKMNNNISNLWTLCLSCHGRKDSIRYWISRGKIYSDDILKTYRLESW